MTLPTQGLTLSAQLIKRSLVVCSIAALCAASTGCSNTRSLMQIRHAADRAYVLEDYDLAEQEYRELLSRQPGNLQARTRLGKLHMARDEFSQAREQFELAYSIKPTDEDVFGLLIESMARSGETDAVIEELRAAATLHQRPADWAKLGRYHARIGDDDSAESALLLAARLDKGQAAEYQMILARFYEGVGQEEEQLQRLRMALYLDPANGEIAQAIRDLGQIPGPTYGIVPAEQHASGALGQ